MKKFIILVITIILIVCIIAFSFCVVNYVKIHNLLEDGYFCKSLSFQDTNSILKTFEISNMEFVNTEYVYYKETWKENYTVVKMILPHREVELFENEFSSNWVLNDSLESQSSVLESFTDWWEIPTDEILVDIYTNENLLNSPTQKCVLLKYSKSSNVIFYLYTDVYNENVLDIVAKSI